MAFVCEIFDGIKEVHEIGKNLSSSPDRMKAFEELREELFLAYDKTREHKKRLGLSNMKCSWCMIDHERDMLLYQQEVQASGPFTTSLHSVWEFRRAGEKFTIWPSRGTRKQIAECERLTEKAKAQGLNKHYSVVNIDWFWLGKSSWENVFAAMEQKEEIFQDLTEAFKLDAYTHLSIYSNPPFDPETEVVMTLVDMTLATPIYYGEKQPCIYWGGEWIKVKHERGIDVVESELPPQLMSRKEELRKDIAKARGCKATIHNEFRDENYVW